MPRKNSAIASQNGLELRSVPIARSIDSCGRRWLIAMLIAI